jgi:hypothetical protein
MYVTHHRLPILETADLKFMLKIGLKRVGWRIKKYIYVNISLHNVYSIPIERFIKKKPTFYTYNGK